MNATIETYTTEHVQPNGYRARQTHADPRCSNRHDGDTIVERNVDRASEAAGWDCECLLDLADEKIAAVEMADPNPERPQGGGGKGRPIPDYDDALASVSAWVATFDRKLDVADLDGHADSRYVAREWAKRSDSDFAFLVEMKAAATERGKLSDGQAKGTLNCLRAALYRAKPKVDITPKVAEATGTPIPDGTYTVVFGDEADYLTLRLRTQKDDASFAPGEQVAKFLDGPDNSRSYVGFGFTTGGTLRVWKRFATDSTRLVEAVRVLFADPRAAASAYGLRSGKCGICSRKLTVPESIKTGIGPVCREKAGWSA
jgi:hypothetical protein